MPAVRSSVPFQKLDGTRAWACLLECTHSITVTLQPGKRMRKGKLVDCPICDILAGEMPEWAEPIDTTTGTDCATVAVEETGQ